MTNTDPTSPATPHAAEPWAAEYLPYTSSRSSGIETEIPCYRIHCADASDESYICETNEHLNGATQKANARRICAAVNAYLGIEPRR